MIERWIEITDTPPAGNYECSICGKFCITEEYIFEHERPHLVCFECFEHLPEDALQMPDDAHISNSEK